MCVNACAGELDVTLASGLTYKLLRECLVREENKNAALEQQNAELQAKCDVLVADVLDLRDDFQHAEPAFNRIELMIAKAQEAV